MSVYKWALTATLMTFLLACEQVENFIEIGQPRFDGQYAPDLTGEKPENLRLVTFNIEYALEIEGAINELGSHEELKDADVIFLQEMDEIGTEAIAKALSYDYVYYPSNKNIDGRLFGLAILSKWPISNDEKIPLPHTTPINDRKRIALTAEIQLPKNTIRLYNMHPGTLSMPKSQRREQFEAIVTHFKKLGQYQTLERAIIGGDFNTDKSNDIDFLVQLYEAEGFIWASSEVGHTYQKFSGLAKYTLDHVFSKGLEVIDAGKPEQTSASDHLPVWVEWEI